MKKSTSILFASIIGVLLIAVAGLIFYFLGFNSGKNASLSEAAIEKAMVELDDKNKELKDLDKQINNQKDTLAELSDYKQNKEKKTEELAQMDLDITSKSEEITSLDNQISEKTIELDDLKNIVKATGEAPKVLTAGHYTVGKDIPEGRYIVTGDRNFFVYSSSGSLKVNTILGGGSWGEESYTCTLENGDTLELSSKDTFTPIK